jgi:antitoxin HigA-1
MTIHGTPIHPGEVLLEVYMKPATPPLTAKMLARTMRVPMALVTELLSGHQAVTPTIAFRLGVLCRTTAEYWLGLQRTYDAQMRRHASPRTRSRKNVRQRHTAAAA